MIDCRVDSDPGAAREALGLWETTEDLLRDYIAAFNRRDTNAMVALTGPEIVNYPVAIVAARQYLGHQGIRNWIRKLTAADQDYTVEAREVRKLEEGRWAVLGALLIDRGADQPVRRARRRRARADRRMARIPQRRELAPRARPPARDAGRLI